MARSRATRGSALRRPGRGGENVHGQRRRPRCGSPRAARRGRAHAASAATRESSPGRSGAARAPPPGYRSRPRAEAATHRAISGRDPSRRAARDDARLGGRGRPEVAHGHPRRKPRLSAGLVHRSARESLATPGLRRAGSSSGAAQGRRRRARYRSSSMRAFQVVHRRGRRGGEVGDGEQVERVEAPRVAREVAHRRGRSQGRSGRAGWRRGRG